MSEMSTPTARNFASEANQFSLVADEQLPAIYAGQIQPFWGATGKFDAFRGKAGVSIAYASFVQERRDTAVVISSGRTESFLKYKELVWDLWCQGFSIYIHDHRGQGLSGQLIDDPALHDLGHVESFDDYVADLKTFVDEVVRPSGHRGYVLLGHSMGGGIAALYVAKHTGDFEAAILSSPMLKPNIKKYPDWVTRIVLGMADLIGKGREWAQGEPSPWKDSPFTEGNGYSHSATRWEIAFSEFRREPKARLGGASKKWVKEALDVGRKACAMVGRIQIPVLLIQAGADQVVDASAQVDFRDRLNKARRGACSFVQIDGGFHELFIESDRYRTPAVDAVIRYIKDPQGEALRLRGGNHR